jgi:hypothetical protein
MASIETKFFRRTAGYPLFDHKNYEEILEDLKVEPDDMKSRRYKSNWLIHATRMNKNRVPKIILNCRTNGRIGLGRHFKRLLDEAEAGLSRPDW